jgi:phage terminase large subunit-like protein
MKVCLGFDGSTSDDWTALKAETFDGLLFTPTYGPDKRPTIWNPAEWGGSIPRGEVRTAVAQVFAEHDVKRMYCDPRDWQTEIDAWALEHGTEVVAEWATYRTVPMHAALERFVTDLTTGALKHDGCPITTQHIDNCRKVAKPGERYILSKPAGAYHQKIDAAVASVICHEAAADARAAGWGEPIDSRMFAFR